ncbi:MAG TPA: PaaI family thioesterase [Anaeromyxobacteraceae bacterium]|nr:PaaI family thioesterase [Anaeromyxobacteraceae bacterium]
MSTRQPSSRTCFVCGRDNHSGLGARWTGDRATGEVRAQIAIPERFNGYPGVVHGGVVTALLDEAMARTALIQGGFEDLMVTARMEVAFRRPVPTATPVTVVGRLRKKSASRAQAEAEVRLPDGSVAAHAEALMTRPPPEVAAGWAAERPYWRVDE